MGNHQERKERKRRKDRGGKKEKKKSEEKEEGAEREKKRHFVGNRSLSFSNFLRAVRVEPTDHCSFRLESCTQFQNACKVNSYNSHSIGLTIAAINPNQ